MVEFAREDGQEPSRISEIETLRTRRSLIDGKLHIALYLREKLHSNIAIKVFYIYVFSKPLKTYYYKLLRSAFSYTSVR